MDVDLLFYQKNVRWGRIPLGLYGGHTLASAGCLISAAAGMLAAVFGVDTDPGRLNRWLCRNRGFVQGNLLDFGVLEQFGLTGKIIDCANVPAPMDLIAAVIDAGGSVLAKVDFIPGGPVNQHWIRLVECDDKDCLIHDPWLPASAGTYSLMARYAHHTWPAPSRALFRVALYQKEESTFSIPQAIIDSKTLVLSSVRANAQLAVSPIPSPGGVS